MGKKSKAFKIWKLVVIVILAVTASILTHVFDKWTIPVQNEVTMNQVNGGDAEMIAMHSTNSVFDTIRTMTWPVAAIIILCIIMTEVVRVIKIINKNNQA